MIVYFYDCNDDPRTVPKRLQNETQASGEIRGEIDVQNPIFLIEGDTSIKNYAYIPDFDRYYYVSPPRIVRTGISEITLKVDVLQSFMTGIFNAPIVAERSANCYNYYVADPERKFYQYTVNQYLDIGSVGIPDTPIMVTVG